MPFDKDGNYIREPMDTKVAAEICAQLQAINWEEFQNECQRKTAPIVRAYREARFRTLERMARYPKYLTAA